MFYTIYKITNNINNKFYIGVHQTNNIDDDYMGSGKILKKSISKYGIENFTKEILVLCSSQYHMYCLENLIVDKEFTKRKDTYNIKIGGEGGWGYCNTDNMLEKRSWTYKIWQNSGVNAFKTLYNEDENFKNSFLKKSKENIKKASKQLIINYPNGVWLGKKHKQSSKEKIGKANSFYQKGKGNSQYGTCWVYSIELKENKKIPKKDVDIWIKKGYTKGRKMKF